MLVGVYSAFCFSWLLQSYTVNTSSDGVSEPNYSSSKENEDELENLKNENNMLKEKIGNMSGDIQLLDHLSRRIMKYIKENRLDELESDFMVEVERTSEDRLIFGNFSEFAFPIEWASYPMYFGFYNPSNDQTEIGYYLYDDTEGRETKYLIAFYYDKANNFAHIFIGET
jgi:TolA-binding protein